MQRHPALGSDACHQHAVVAEAREVLLFCDFSARLDGKVADFSGSAKREHVSDHVIKNAYLGEQTRAVVL